MPEISLRGKKYIGIFDGDKQIEERIKDRITYNHKCYYGAGFIHKSKSNSKKRLFRFLVREDYCKSSLKETLEKLAIRGHDSFLESIIFRIKESSKHIPKIYLPK